MSDKWTKEDEELYQKKYEESLKELGEIYGDTWMNPKNHVDWNDSIKRKEAKKARDSMIEFGKGKSVNDKIQAVDDALTAIGAAGTVVKGAKDAKNAKTQQKAKAGQKSYAVGEKMAAGAEGMSFTTPRESLDTRDLTAEQYKNLKNGLRDAARKLDVGDFALDPTVDVSEYNGKVISKPKKKKDGKSVIAKMSLEPDVKRNAITKAGYETVGDWKKAGNKHYQKMVDKPTEYEPTSKSKDTHALDESIRLGNEVYERNHGEEKQPTPNRQLEQDNVINIANFMNKIEKSHPELAESIRKNAKDLHIRDKHVPSVLGGEKTSSGTQRNEEFLKTRGQPIANGVMSQMSDEEIIHYGKELLGKDYVERILADKMVGSEAKKKIIAGGIGTLVASFMYSEDKDSKLANKVAAGNKEQLSGIHAPAWTKDKAKVWDDWFDTFDANKMENDKDYQAYLEAFQLMDDYKRGKKMVAEDGNTHPMAELLTNPKYVKLLTKYNPDDAKKVFGLGKK